MSLLTASDKALWRLALPMIFSNITVPLLGLVDTAVIGHLDSPVYLGGVAIGATATSFLFMLLLFLRMSTTGLTAQAYGAKDPLRLARALVQPLILALGAGVLIVLLRTPLIDLALHVVGGSAFFIPYIKHWRCCIFADGGYRRTTSGRGVAGCCNSGSYYEYGFRGYYCIVVGYFA